MVWRDILTFVDGSDDGLARMQMALSLAETHGAHVQADIISVFPHMVYGLGSNLLGPAYEDACGAIRKEAADGLGKVRALGPAAADRMTVHARECHMDDVRALAAREARSADIVIVGQPERLDGSDVDTEIFAGAVMGGGRPCLMLPRWITPHPYGKRALIAWKGSAESARAVQAALPFLAAAETVRICVANPRSAREGEDARGIARLATYLSRHGARVEEPVMRESWEGPEKMMLSEIEGFAADLLVMGAYSRPRFQETVFGGMTAAMVREARIPILFAH